MPAGPSIIQKFWDELDAIVDTIITSRDKPMDPAEREEIQDLKGQARGLAKAIQIISVPHFEDENAVSKHAAKRWAAARDGEDLPLTPGCDGYNPMPTVKRDLGK